MVSVKHKQLKTPSISELGIIRIKNTFHLKIN